MSTAIKTYFGDYDIQNGLGGHLQSIILRLCDLAGDRIQNIRLLIGLCQEHFLLKNHSLFIKIRVRNFFLFVPSSVVAKHVKLLLDYDEYSNNIFNPEPKIEQIKNIDCTFNVLFHLATACKNFRSLLLDFDILKALLRVFRMGLGFTLMHFHRALHILKLYALAGAETDRPTNEYYDKFMEMDVMRVSAMDEPTFRPLLSSIIGVYSYLNCAANQLKSTGEIDPYKSDMRRFPGRVLSWYTQALKRNCASLQCLFRAKRKSTAPSSPLPPLSSGPHSSRPRQGKRESVLYAAPHSRL